MNIYKSLFLGLVCSAGMHCTFAQTSRYIVHTGRHEIKLIINPDQIRIGPVSPHDRVRKCSILIIRIPNSCLSEGAVHSCTTHQS